MNVVWQNNKVSYEQRCRVLEQKGIVVWFTGLSGAGKSTIAIEVEKYLNENNKAVYLLDGDNLRYGINSDLGFTDSDRNENIRRIIEISLLFKDAGIITLVSVISPFEEMRKLAKQKIGDKNFIEVYVKADINICRERDPKGLYKKNINNFTGVTSSYEIPLNPDIILDTEKLSVEKCKEQIIKLIFERIEKI